MATPSLSSSTPQKTSGAQPRRKRGGQPGNQNARKVGTFSVHQPGPLSGIYQGMKNVSRAYTRDLLSSVQILNQTEALFELLDGYEDLETHDILGFTRLQIALVKLRFNAKQSMQFIHLRQQALQKIAHNPFVFIESHFKDHGIKQDADSFFPVPKKSAQNSAYQAQLEAWGRLPFDHPTLATNLTDEQWALLAPLIPPDPALSWLTGQPPIIIAANRFGFSQYAPTGEFADFEIMQTYRAYLQKFPALLQAPPPAPSALQIPRRGRPRNPSYTPRALLDAILWKLATGQNWADLPLGFPPPRRCAKYYRRLFLSGRLYTLLLALYNHLRLEACVDTYLLLQEGVFSTTPDQSITLSRGILPTSQNCTALLFLQLARQSYTWFDRKAKQDNPFHKVLPVFKGPDSHTTAQVSVPQPQLINLEPLEQSSAFDKLRKMDRLLKSRRTKKQAGK
ncbi:MAG TPA: transposase [Anaerolineales bacterium]|nr:transposase [Anaerolineales bacterium]